MSLFNLGDRFGRRGDPEVVHECRRCGESVDPGTTECPTCGTDSIARYEIQ